MERMTVEDKQFIKTLLEGIEDKVENLAKLFQKDIDTSNERAAKIEDRQDEFRDDLRDIYPRLTTVEGEIKTINEKMKQSNSLKSNIISGCVVGIIVFVVTYFVI